MLSRAILRSVAQKPLGAICARSAASAVAPTEPEFRRPVRLEYPGKVRMGFIPDEWFTFFYKKTGVTGPYVFGASVLTYLCSKEIYIMEHEYYNGLSLALLMVILVKKVGPGLAASLDKEIDEIENEWKSSREEEIKALEDAIKEEETEQWRAEGQLMLIEAKKENVALQLEAAYRERLARVFNEVKRRLDYQVQCQMIERRMSQKHMVNWIVNNVLKSITPDQERESLNRCIGDLGKLATVAK